MNIEEVLELLEINSPDVFEYFEHMAELLECPEEISHEVFHTILKEVEPEILEDLIDSYFEDVLKAIPDDATELYTLVSTIQQQLLNLVSEASDQDQKRQLIDELYRFRTWYAFDSVVICKNKTDGLTINTTVLEALTLHRLEKLGEQAYEYDFSESIDYPLDELSFKFSYSIEDDLFDEDDDDEDDDLANNLIDKEFPVIDGEFSDEDY
ncbi:MAG: hypothetical protein GX076_01380 [Clostridiales bacterium]|nr:hypothetical protein [Clostridiales bacterium]